MGETMIDKVRSLIFEKSVDELEIGYAIMVEIFLVMLLIGLVIVNVIHSYDLKILKMIIIRTRLMTIILVYLVIAPWVVLIYLDIFARINEGKLNYYQILFLLFDCRIDYRAKGKIDFDKNTYKELYEQYIGQYTPWYYFYRLKKTFSEAFFLSVLLVLLANLISK